ncbi:hypothetical protein EJ08DRAFT_692444 [Tothia fuscella]|uniref:Uncharacterized protein n=1 Tax=Tothia fuscella TaxID=1048955 RepID=A0A9P4P220_9PEZI|nr:hypothetical protein EJ08DRAFT_692444 [Tothia fuscella]
MSLQDIVNAPEPAQTFDAVLKETKTPLRSWRKKYRKMKLHFDKVMDESNKLYKDCYKLESLAKRLQEENDQFMEILLDLNESYHIPASYVLGKPDEAIVPSASDIPNLEPDVPRTLSSLLKVPHTRLGPDTKLPDHLLGEHIPGYLTTAHEEEYLSNLDAQIATDDAFDDIHRQLTLPPSRILPSEKELHNSNPMSVLSWLRRHHPETFIQEKEAASERSAPRARGGGGKRSSLATALIANPAAVSVSTPGPKAEHDTADEEHPAVELVGSEQGSGRKGKGRKDDEPYRPKGGSSRPAKRKRDDGETPKGRGGKRAKAQTSTPTS